MKIKEIVGEGDKVYRVYLELDKCLIDWGSRGVEIKVGKEDPDEEITKEIELECVYSKKKWRIVGLSVTYQRHDGDISTYHLEPRRILIECPIKSDTINKIFAEHEWILNLRKELGSY